MRIADTFCKRRPPTTLSVGTLIAAAFVMFVLSPRTFGQSELDQSKLDAILQIERGGQGIVAATAAVEELRQQGIGLEAILNKAAKANPISKNWLLAIAQALVDRHPEASRATLERLLDDQASDGELRYWALDRLAERKKEVREQMLDGRIEDTSLDIRYEAIELALKKLPTVDEAKADEQIKMQLLPSLERLLDASRLADQTFAINGRLKALDAEVDLLKHFGFVTSWQVIGPFDNRQEVGFNAIYPPEAEYLSTGKLNATRGYTGKTGETAWQNATTDKPDGVVDLNPLFANEKGAVVYAYTTFESTADMHCQVRFGTPNANKVWVNGKESTKNNVYHTGSPVDQYVGPAELKRGTNSILIKVCQNEQTEEWAQDFTFKLRFSDATGKAVHVTQ